MTMSSSSWSCSTDLQNTKSSSSSFNNCVFQMTTHNNQQSPPTTTDSTAHPPPRNNSSSGNGNRKSVDDVWKEITTSTCCKQEKQEDHHPAPMMTLEDFLAKADDVKLPSFNSLPTHNSLLLLSGGRMFSFDSPQSNLNLNDASPSPGTGKRKLPPSLLLPDKAAQQRQKRMIKNRESAARSRQRKQAYQTQLESLAFKLEQDNHTLSIAKAEQSRSRYKQLMDNIIPVTEKRRPPTRYLLRKVRSMEW